jgi:hypothetical protein
MWASPIQDETATRVSLGEPGCVDATDPDMDVTCPVDAAAGPVLVR